MSLTNYFRCRVKICGITNIEDALDAVSFGADALGFIFYPPSPRYILPKDAKEIIRQIPPFVSMVGVFVNEQLDVIKQVVDFTGINFIQLHGEESPTFCSHFTNCIKSFRVKSPSDIILAKEYNVNTILLDSFSNKAYGGTGKVFDWNIAIEAKKYGNVILAGGLTPENVQDAISTVKPYAVDVSSAIEHSKGKKDKEKMRQFILKAHGLFRQ